MSESYLGLHISNFLSLLTHSSVLGLDVHLIPFLWATKRANFRPLLHLLDPLPLLAHRGEQLVPLGLEVDLGRLDHSRRGHVHNVLVVFLSSQCFLGLRIFLRARILKESLR